MVKSIVRNEGQMTDDPRTALTREKRRIERTIESLQRKLEELAEILIIEPFDKKAAMAYGDVRSSLEKRGMIIGSNDMLIAAHALSRDWKLVTNNEKEFRRVKGLKVENWVNE